MKRTVVEMLRKAVSEHGDRPYTAEKKGGKYVTSSFAEIEKKAICLAAGLNKEGLKKDAKIAILSEGRTDWITAEFGILMNRCISVPLSVQLLPQEILFRLNHSEASAIIVSKNYIEKVFGILNEIENNNFRIIYIDDDIDNQYIKAKQKGISEEKILSLKKLIEKSEQNYETNRKIIEEQISKIEENDTLTISYTSGTTGNPKGIMLTHLNYYSNSNNSMQYFDVPMYYRLFIVLPLDHSFAHTVGIYASLIRAMAIYFVDASNGAKAALKNIPINLKEANPHFMLTVPALSGNFMNKIKSGINKKGGIIKFIFDKGLKAGIEIYGNGHEKINPALKMLKMPIYKLADAILFKKIKTIWGKNIKFFVGGGALLDIKQQLFFNAIGVPVYQGYGLTEATPIISVNTSERHKFGTSGMIIPKLECKIIKASGEEAKTNEKGEIVIKGDNVMKGYYKNKEATKETIKDEKLYTGDMGYYDEDNFLVVVGREKALLISQDGEKYSPEGIEEAIKNCSDLIAQTMVYNDHEKYTTALITLDNTALDNLIKQKK